jgi:hypothetical protein
MKTYLLLSALVFFITPSVEASRTRALSTTKMLSFAFKAAGYNATNIVVTESESVDGFAYRAANATGLIDFTGEDCELPYTVKEVHFDYNGTEHNCQINYKIYEGNGLLDYYIELQLSSCTTGTSRAIAEKILGLNLIIDGDLSGYSNNRTQHRNGIKAWEMACENN